MSKLRILHCLRAPVGGLFRHVRDLVIEQSKAGHEVAVVCDSNSEDGLTEQRLNELKKHLELGLHRISMSRDIGLSDFNSFQEVRDLSRNLGVDIIHGHGAKGGAYARLAASDLRSKSVEICGIYTPHGGSLHYDAKSLKGMIFKFLEQSLARRSDAIIFESDYARSQFDAKMGTPDCPVKVIPNGLAEADFEVVDGTNANADILFVGELRQLKGVDTLIEAAAILSEDRPCKVLIVGDGPDRKELEELVKERGLETSVTFAGALPARDAFAMARCIAVPSRAESLPYVVLEAAAARLPIVATNVGGIPEIVANTTTQLIDPDAPDQLAAALRQILAHPDAAVVRAGELRAAVQSRFNVARMAHDVLAVYDDVLARSRNVARVAA